MVALPRPNPSAEGQPFWDYLKQGELRIQRCTNCGTFRQPPQPTCRHCGSFENEWAKMSGRGTVYSYIVSRQAIHPALTDLVPFATVVVELEEGPHLTSNLTNVSPDEVRIGQPVELEIVDKGEGLLLPLFRRTGGTPLASE